MRVLIVVAHHEQTSFNVAMAEHATSCLKAAGHEVKISDLYQMGFDPVSDRRNFTTVIDSTRLRQQAEERYANQHNGFVAELAQEMQKLAWCDLLIFQFPIWWLGMPAIMKGWIDRVFTLGHAYGGGRYFENGMFAGKRAFCSLTVGGLKSDYDGSGAYQSIDKVLYPIHRGILAFTGFTVLPPFVVYAPERKDMHQRIAELARYSEMLDSIKGLQALQF
ncbi:MAG: NAD(P)H-dependent oxidoreductase [Burkholderiaceae bacterium]|nr:NAD(P)H-dependent oxidoreductase [Burkholderiaceae bacterium]